MNVSFRKWHSINFFPCLSAYDICDGTTMKTASRHVELIVLGVIVEFGFKTQAKRDFFITPAFGPLWSRRRRRIYWAKDV